MDLSRQSPNRNGPDICEALQLHKRFEPITDKELQIYFEGRRVAAEDDTHTHTAAHLYKNSCSYIQLICNSLLSWDFSRCSTYLRSEPLAVAGRASDCSTGCAHQHVARTATNHQGGR